jgi:type IV secretory pathway TraG/TraD family ATPase VirD4
MSATSRRSGGGSQHGAELVLLWAFIGIVGVVGGLVTASVHFGASLDDSRQALPANPFTLMFGLADKRIRWPSSATAVLIAFVALLLLVAAVATVVYLRHQKGRTRVDRAASRMGCGRDIAPLGQRNATETAKRLGVDSPGLPIGRTIAGNRPLYASWEDVCVDISGPRTGKTTGTAIPMLLAAPGAAVVTSNKRDIVDATRDLRSDVGEVFVFDPQGLVDEPADWWWNPLSFVTDEVKASMLADIFVSASRDPNARGDAYFDAAGAELMGNLLLAAALGNRAITQVYLWLTDPTDEEPVAILRDHDYEILAAALQGVINYPEKQRAGVFGTARQIGSFLTNREAMRWVTPPSTPRARAGADGGANPWLTSSSRREFHPGEFVRGTGTLYSVSKEGVGSAGPLVTALTMAVLEAAEERAKRSPGGRLPVPLVAVLDEIANVVRARAIPAQFSHFGSRGIVVMAILQSWSQGVEVWGRDGMRKLWSAANVKVYGGGVAEVEFLNELSQLIGDFDLTTTSVSFGRGGRSTNRAVRRERVLDVADLTAMPKGRTVVFASGAPGTLVRRVPWMDGPDADRVAASIRRHDPAAEETIAAVLADADAPTIGVA